MTFSRLRQDGCSTGSERALRSDRVAVVGAVILAAVFFPQAYASDDSIEELSLSIAGSDGSSLARAQRLVAWMNESFEWSYTDYESRTVPQIIERRAGNCSEQSRVLFAMLEPVDVRRRWVKEINIQRRNRPRETTAKRMVEEKGNTASVFGLMHNDHRWLEVYDDAKKEWIPCDPTLGIFGLEEWIAMRVGFGKRPRDARPMLAPFVVIADEDGGAEVDRTEYYLIEGFDAHFGNELSELPAWEHWVSSVRGLAPLGAAAFAGEVNLHDHVDRMEALRAAYDALKEQSLARTASE